MDPVANMIKPPMGNADTLRRPGLTNNQIRRKDAPNLRFGPMALLHFVARPSRGFKLCSSLGSLGTTTPPGRGRSGFNLNSNMKKPIFLRALAASLALTAWPVSADDPVTPSVPRPPLPASQPATPPVAATPPAAPNSAVVPGAGFSAPRYEVLWTKSPFAVATSEAAVDTSPDYLFVGFDNVDGVSYASVIDVHTQEHFLISSDRPNRGLTLTSITRGHDGGDTYAQIQKDGQTISLKLEQAPVPGGLAVSGMAGTPQIPMPGITPSFNVGSLPRTRFHRPLIHLPTQAPQPSQ